MITSSVLKYFTVHGENRIIQRGLAAGLTIEQVRQLVIDSAKCAQRVKYPSGVVVYQNDKLSLVAVIRMDTQHQHFKVFTVLSIDQGKRFSEYITDVSGFFRATELLKEQNGNTRTRVHRQSSRPHTD